MGAWAFKGPNEDHPTDPCVGCRTEEAEEAEEAEEEEAEEEAVGLGLGSGSGLAHLGGLVVTTQGLM